MKIIRKRPNFGFKSIWNLLLTGRFLVSNLNQIETCKQIPQLHLCSRAYIFVLFQNILGFSFTITFNACIFAKKKYEKNLHNCLEKRMKTYYVWESDPSFFASISFQMQGNKRKTLFLRVSSCVHCSCVPVRNIENYSTKFRDLSSSLKAF